MTVLYLALVPVFSMPAGQCLPTNEHLCRMHDRRNTARPLRGEDRWEAVGKKENSFNHGKKKTWQKFDKKERRDTLSPEIEGPCIQHTRKHCFVRLSLVHSLLIRQTIPFGRCRAQKLLQYVSFKLTKKDAM